MLLVKRGKKIVQKTLTLAGETDLLYAFELICFKGEGKSHKAGSFR